MARRSLPAVCALLALLCAADAGAQQRWSVALVPADHWTVDALRRLSGLGLLLGGHDLSRRMPTQREVGSLLEGAASVESPYRGLATAYLDRFEDEFDRAAAASSGRPAYVAAATGSAVGVGWRSHDGRLATGWGYGFGFPDRDWNQPVELDPISDPTIEGTLQVSVERVAVRLTGGYPAGAEAVREAYAAVGTGPVSAWLGRRTFGWGPSSGPSVVMNAGRYDSFGLLSRPFRLPWVLRHLGPVAVELAVGQEDLERSFDDTAFLATRGSVTPHERLQLGVTRAAFFGGEGNDPVDLFDVLSVLIGKHAGEVASEQDNQVVAVDVSFRAPTEQWIPLRAYVEWGFEDSAGAFRSVPGVLAGVDIPAVPGARALAVALERTSFAASCCGNPIWYRHSNFQDGWTQDGEPLGHPLAGHGDEWRLHARLDALEARLRVAISGFARERGIENLYADQRLGDSAGGTIRLEADITSGLRARAEGRVEDGEGWREVEVVVALRAIL